MPTAVHAGQPRPAARATEAWLRPAMPEAEHLIGLRACPLQLLLVGLTEDMAGCVHVHIEAVVRRPAVEVRPLIGAALAGFTPRRVVAVRRAAWCAEVDAEGGS